MIQREKRKGKYLKPIDKTIKMIEEMKKQKEEEKDKRDRIRAEVADSAASPEKNDAIVFKYMNDQKNFQAFMELVLKIEV